MLYPEMVAEGTCCKAAPHRWMHGFPVVGRVVAAGTYFNRAWRRKHGTR